MAIKFRLTDASSCFLTGSKASNASVIFARRCGFLIACGLLKVKKTTLILGKIIVIALNLRFTSPDENSAEI